jgi:hypothetical protein
VSLRGPLSRLSRGGASLLGQGPACAEGYRQLSVAGLRGLGTVEPDKDFNEGPYNGSRASHWAKYYPGVISFNLPDVRAAFPFVCMQRGCLSN